MSARAATAPLQAAIKSLVFYSRRSAFLFSPVGFVIYIDTSPPPPPLIPQRKAKSLDVC